MVVVEWWQTVALTVVSGLLIAAIGARVVGHQREMGRSRAATTIAHREVQREKHEADERAAQAHADRQAAATALADELQRIRSERIGATFLQRSDPDDPGVILTVDDLDPKAPHHRVMVLSEPAPDRVDRDHGLSPGRVSMEWRFLTLPEAEQRHRTARLIEDSFDDNLGWVEVERLG